MIIGQEKLVKEVNRIFDIFTSSEGEIRPHFVLTGDSGSGKTHTIKTLCKQKELGFVEINSAQLTKEGTSGKFISCKLNDVFVDHTKGVARKGFSLAIEPSNGNEMPDMPEEKADDLDF